MRFAPRRIALFFVQAAKRATLLTSSHALGTVLLNECAQLARNIGLSFRRDEVNAQAAELFFDL